MIGNKFKEKRNKLFLYLITIIIISFIIFSFNFILCMNLYNILFNKEDFVDVTLQENYSESIKDEDVPAYSESSIEDIGDTSEDNIEDIIEDNIIDEYEVSQPNNESLVDYKTEMVVYSFEDLKVALESSTITTIYFGDNIIMEEGGIVINPAKEYLIIDGINPYDTSGSKHSLTEYNALLKDQTMLLKSNNGLKSITMRNIIIYGRNYYGIICIDDPARNVITTYENLEYYGPQLAYNRYGTVILDNVLIKIGKFNGISPAQEVAEVGNVVLKGDVNITQVESQTYEIFYFPLQSGKIELASDAVINISVFDISGFVFSAYKVDFIARYGSQFYYTAPLRFFESAGAMNNFTVEDYAKVHINITNRKDNDLLLVNDSLYVGEGSQLHLISNKGLFPVLRVGKKCVFNNPDSVLLYSPAFRPISYLTLGELDIKAEQLNYWNKAEVNTPLYSWRKDNQELLKLNGTVYAGDLGIFSLISTNYSNEDTSSPVLPNGSNFNMINARVISIGRVDMGVNERSLQFDFLPNTMFFPVTEIKSYPEVIKRKENDWRLIICDSLNDGNKWKLTVNIALETEDDNRIPLPNGSLIFIDEHNNIETLSKENDVLIMQHTSIKDIEFLPVSWEAEKGILLYIEPGTVESNIIYTATLQWNLINAP